jgi:uncharacterized damage-inducible protein DinB
MKKLQRFIVICSCLLLSNLSFGQSPVSDIVKEWERAKAYTKEYLDAMPTDKYSFKPTPEMRSFAEQMLHLTATTYAFASAATDGKSPYAQGELDKLSDQSKENVIKVVLTGYDFVINELKTLSPEKLNEKVKLFGRFELSRAQVFEKDFEHQTHHRAQTTVYLRLSGVTPPQEKLF